ncbi:MAG: hypothetical protein ICV60_21440 [Pyrinomonadaceae bacterium]|nr:hypothetical protein [Pyrinomonadaceae bacterium]
MTKPKLTLANEQPSRSYALGYLVPVVGLALCIAAFYPGYMSPDSVAQWEQGRAWVFTDAHPPLMSALWGILDRIIPGPFGMLLFHNLMFWGGAALYWRAAKQRSAMVATGLLLFGFMPQVLGLLSSILKDIGMGASLLLATALFYQTGKTKSRVALYLSCPLLFYAYSVRLNSAPAIFPLALWSAFLACRVIPFLKRRLLYRSFLTPVICGILYFALLSVAVTATTKLLAQDKHDYPVQIVLLYDLAAISNETGQSYFPAYISEYEGFSMQKVAENYNTEWVADLIYGPKPVLATTRQPELISELKAHWWNAVSAHPVIYLKHRWNVFTSLNGFNTEYVYKAFLPVDGYNPRQFRQERGALNHSLNAYFFYFSRSILFRGFFWLLICVGLIYFAVRSRLRGDMGAVLALATSGFLYTAGYFFYTPSSEFRYIWWTVISAIVALLLFISQLVSERAAGNLLTETVTEGLP